MRTRLVTAVAAMAAVAVPAQSQGVSWSSQKRDKDRACLLVAGGPEQVTDGKFGVFAMRWRSYRIEAFFSFSPEDAERLMLPEVGHGVTVDISIVSTDGSSHILRRQPFVMEQTMLHYVATGALPLEAVQLLETGKTLELRYHGALIQTLDLASGAAAIRSMGLCMEEFISEGASLPTVEQ